MTSGISEVCLTRLEEMEPLDPDLELEVERLRLQEASIRCEQRLRALKLKRDSLDSSIGAGAGDSNERGCECHPRHKSWDESSDEGNSSPSTCILCSERDRLSGEYSPRDQFNSATTVTAKTTSDTKTDATDDKMQENKCEDSCDLRYSDLFYCDEEDDETRRIMQARSVDYSGMFVKDLRVVVALSGYPKARMRLHEMALFKKSLEDVTDMQLKAGLLKKLPEFTDYYLNRGAVVCVCKDAETRDWVVRICPGLEERMNYKLVMLKAKAKKLCLAVLKIPRGNWPATAQDAFKLLQYFNTNLKSDLWRIYSQKIIDDMEYTSFLVDKVSVEILRGPLFKNVIDYNQMEFELNGFTEIYYDSLLCQSEDDVQSIASRMRHLEEIKSSRTTPKVISASDLNENELRIPIESDKEHESKLLKMDETFITQDMDDKTRVSGECRFPERLDLEESQANEIADNEEVDENTAESITDVSDKTESIAESVENLSRNSTLNIDSSRGIAYHRRTNYLHVENELKLAVTLEGYPQNKLEGTHIRRLKHLFKEYLHKDMKLQRFNNLIIPKFQDIYLSNGAVIYICDSLETKDYLMEVLPKFVNSTGLKLTFRDMNTLVRYTRVVMRIPKIHAHLETLEVLLKVQEEYPGLKPECWKFYSDIAGKQKRQFGVDPVSLEVIKSPDFHPTYEGVEINFRVIDRQKRDVSFDEFGTQKRERDVVETQESKSNKERILKIMHQPLELDYKTCITRTRTNHYSDLIADDLKLYVSPSNYPECRVDETLFFSIKRCLENIVCDAVDKEDLTDDTIPKLHDMYLFDGVIFVICENFASRCWVQQSLPVVSLKLKISLTATEFRGAVGIISMFVKTNKGTDEVIEMLQKQNPRLRTKYWRKISTVQTETKLDVVLQIDKLSAQVIVDPEFNKFIGTSAVQFKLGHLESLIIPKASLEKIKTNKKVSKKSSKSKTKIMFKASDKVDVLFKEKRYKDLDHDPMIVESPTREDYSPTTTNSSARVILKVPPKLLLSKEEFNAIFDLLEDMNPGLNTELWHVCSDEDYTLKGRISLIIDKKSASIIQGKGFYSTVGGEKVKFFFE